MKAGCIPFLIDEDEIFMLFQISSDPEFGGSDPMISKGKIDEGETSKVTARREATEELGLRESNIVPGTLRKVWTGRSKGYQLIIYTCQVKNKTDFDIPHYETKAVVWMTMEEFRRAGRKDHVPIVEAIHKMLP